MDRRFGELAQELAHPGVPSADAPALAFSGALIAARADDSHEARRPALAKAKAKAIMPRRSPPVTSPHRSLDGDAGNGLQSPT